MNIFGKLFEGNKQNAFDSILSFYQNQGFTIIHYLYFASCTQNGLMNQKKLNTAYKEAIMKGDILLPDGIALRWYTKKWYKKNLENLNGTDFSEYFLSRLKGKKIQLILYGAKEGIIEKAVHYIEQKYKLKVFYFQNGYKEFDFSQLEGLSIDTFNILMVGLGTPKQEIWIEQNRKNIIKYHLMAFSQGGTFDFWSGTEKRAPKIIQSMKLEWFWRFLGNPKKNTKKVWNSLKLAFYLVKKEK